MGKFIQSVCLGLAIASAILIPVCAFYGLWLHIIWNTINLTWGIFLYKWDKEIEAFELVLTGGRK